MFIINIYLTIIRKPLLTLTHFYIYNPWITFNTPEYELTLIIVYLLVLLFFLFLSVFVILSPTQRPHLTPWPHLTHDPYSFM